MEGRAEDRVTLSDSFSASVLHHLHLTWIDIAVAHEAEANAARQRGLSAADDQLGHAISAEFNAALVAVAAAAFALEAFRNHLTEVLGVSVPEAVIGEIKARNNSKVPAYESVLATVNAAASLDHYVSGWTGPARRLFRLRNDAVHYRAEWSEPERHPNGRTHSSALFAVYEAAEATRAIDLTFAVLVACAAHPRPEHERVVDWAARESGAIRARQAVRGSL